MKKLKNIRLFDVVNNTFFILVCFISIFPIYLIFANAFSSEADIVNVGYAVFPLHLSVEGFKFVLKDVSQLLYSTGTTIVYAVGSTILSIVIQSMLAYSLSRKEFAYAKLCRTLLFISMFFQAGLIPSYIVRTQIYGLEDNLFVYLVPAVSGFSVLVFCTQFKNLPDSLIESAEIDGATHIQIYSRIVMPLTRVFIATQFFLSMCALWKNYTITLYYIQDKRLYTLEYYIYLISKDAAAMKENLMQMGMSATEIPTETMRFAVVLFTLIPMLVIFPLFQRFMNKGIMVGAVKG